MPAKIDISGQRFGRLVALHVVIKKRANGSPRRFWFCRCDCGNDSLAISSELKSGKHRSCGCLQVEAVTKHGHSPFAGSKSPTYRSWLSMIQRCTNPKATGYHRYGGRGITVCERWRSSFANFLLDMGVRPSTKHSLERINNDRGYESGNVRWATQREQAINRASNRIVRYDNRSQTVIEWIRELELDEELVRSRLKLGWTFDKIVTQARLPQLSGRRRSASGQFAAI